MTNEEMEKGMNAWLQTRPECVQELAKEFPPGSGLDLGDGVRYVLGYTEGDRLIASRISPAVDYNGAYASREHICASHYRSYK